MHSIAALILQHLTRNEPVVLATIARQQGATPRKIGTRMVIAPNGRIHGTIGGGLLEAKVIARAADLLTGGSAYWEPFETEDAHGTDADEIRSGSLEVLFEPLAPTPGTIAFFQDHHQMRSSGGEGAWVTVIQRQAARVDNIDHALVGNDGRIRGVLPLSATMLDKVRRISRTARAMTALETDDRFILLEPIHPPWCAIVVGAGHVAQPTAHLAALVDFETIVLDDRAAFAHRRRFPSALQVNVLPDFNDTFRGLTVGRTAFIIIATRGHLEDQLVLFQALCTGAGYIGMLGSRRKRETLFRRLSDQGFDEADLKRVHCPIGVAIGAETPAEIAVSIVAEMVLVRQRLAGRHV